MADGNGELALRKSRREWGFAAVAVGVVFGLPFVVEAHPFRLGLYAAAGTVVAILVAAVILGA